MKLPNPILDIQGKKIGNDYATYFIADIAANHDGDLKRAKDLIYLAAEAGADAAKFQHFSAKTIVSDYGFKNLGNQQSHQASWKKSVYDIYKNASLNESWTPILKETCDKAGITFFTSPYSIELVDHVDEYLSDDEIPTYKLYANNYLNDDKDQTIPFSGGLRLLKICSIGFPSSSISLYGSINSLLNRFTFKVKRWLDDMFIPVLNGMFVHIFQPSNFSYKPLYDLS